MNLDRGYCDNFCRKPAPGTVAGSVPGLLSLPFFATWLLFGADDLLPQASPAMWAIGGVLVVIVVDVTILFLIVRDVLEDKANPLHWIGAVVAWIGLAFLAEGFKALARALHATEGGATESDFDLWISTALTVILLAFTPTLILLGLVVGRICWRIHQERTAVKSARRLRGTLSHR